MNIIGVGIDIADISRFEDKESLAERVLSPYEFETYKARVDKASFLASRFAVKESYVKASQDKMVDYRKLEVKKDDNGKPSLYLEGSLVKAFLSLSHDKEAIAIVILYKD